MNIIRSLLARAFPLMALTGLLLAGWGMIVTPDDIKGDAQVALWGSRGSPSSLENLAANAWSR